MKVFPENANLTNGGWDVSLQDQHTDDVIAYFNQVSDGTTLSSLAVLNSYTIEVLNATGISSGSYIVLFHPASVRFSTFFVVSIVSTTVTLDSPMDFEYPIGTFVDTSIVNMNVNGAVTPQVFGLRGIGTPLGVELTVDITRIIMVCTTSSAVDLTKFGNLTNLTRGLVLRKRDGRIKNSFNVKNNAEIANLQYDWTPYAASNPSQGVDGFVCRLTFAGQNKIGVTKRLEIGEDLEFWIQDDLRGLISLKAIAEGHVVE